MSGKLRVMMDTNLTNEYGVPKEQLRELGDQISKIVSDFLSKNNVDCNGTLLVDAHASLCVSTACAERRILKAGLIRGEKKLQSSKT